MSTPTRIIINYGTGEMWEVPLDLFENYQRFQFQLSASANSNAQSHAVYELWYASLSDEQQSCIVKA